MQTAQEGGLVKLGTVAIDGTKVKANASKHKSMSYERMQAEEKRLEREIRKILEDASDHPLPETVAVSIRDWGRDMDWVQVRPAMVFSGLRPDRRKVLCELLKGEKVVYQELGRGEILIAGVALQDEDGAEPEFITKLRDEGWLVRIEKDDTLKLRSSGKDSQ